MRTSRTISVSLPPAQFRRAARLAKRENRTLAELLAEALLQYEEKKEATVSHDLLAALRAVQESAKRAGLDKLTARAIDAEVSAYRNASKPIRRSFR